MTWMVRMAVALVAVACCSVGVAQAEAAPVTNLDSVPPAFTNDSTPTFGFSSTPPGATFECRILPDPFASCGSPFDVTPALAEG